MKTQGIDRPFLATTLVFLAVGFMIFSSASLGLLARGGVQFSSVAFSQLILGLGLGTLSMLIVSRIPYRLWRRYALYIFITAMIVTCLVFIPGLGLHAGGAKRWIVLFGISFQPAEFLKFGAILYFAAWLSANRTHLHDYRFGLIPLLLMLGSTGLIMLAQPDTGTYLVIASAIIAMYVTAGARIRDFFILIACFALSIGGLALARPYVMERIETFLSPTEDPQGSGYQIKQSLIAIGSGSWFGRGFGQSVQKFNYLPEPIGDSIFSVAAEEFGMIGAGGLIALYLFFAFRGFRIAAHAPDDYGGLIVVGFTALIVSQSFINIGSMLGVMPLTGVPLPFISHGGTALLFVLTAVGIILNVSRTGPISSVTNTDLAAQSKEKRIKPAV